jgi:hypothetical protein
MVSANWCRCNSAWQRLGRPIRLIVNGLTTTHGSKLSEFREPCYWRDTLKLQVKGSQDGGWGLFQRYIRNADYHRALDAWLLAQKPEIVYFLVQFNNVPVGAVPRCYIATPTEIVAHMHTTRGGHGHTSLRESYSYARGLGMGHTDIIPIGWTASEHRIDEILSSLTGRHS